MSTHHIIYHHTTLQMAILLVKQLIHVNIAAATNIAPPMPKPAQFPNTTCLEAAQNGMPAAKESLSGHVSSAQSQACACVSLFERFAFLLQHVLVLNNNGQLSKVSTGQGSRGQGCTCWAAADLCCLASWRRACAWAAAMRRMEVTFPAFLASIPSLSFFFSAISALVCSSSSCRTKSNCWEQTHALLTVDSGKPCTTTYNAERSVRVCGRCCCAISSPPQRLPA